MDYAYTVIDGGNVSAFAPYITCDLDGLAQEARILALGAVSGGRSCGAAVFRCSGDEAALCSLYIDPGLRRKKLGTMLLTQGLARLAGCRRVTARFCEPPETARALAAFLRASWGGVPQKVASVFCLSLKETLATPFFPRFGRARTLSPPPTFLCPAVRPPAGAAAHGCLHPGAAALCAQSHGALPAGELCLGAGGGGGRLHPAGGQRTGHHLSHRLL